MCRRRLGAGGWLAALLVLAGCASPPPAVVPAPPPPSPPRAEAPPPTPARAPYDEAGGQILARGARQLVYLPVAGDSWRGIARRLLGDPGLDWSIAEANRVADMAPPAPGVAVLVPLVPRNPAGIHPEWFQTVPILCYHRFGPVATKMTITPQAFAQQLEHLAKNGWRVIPLAELRGFLDARKPLPPRTVVITMDDGYESVHRHAFPLLKKHGFPATLFVYTDFIGAPDALSWSQLQEMQRSGLVDVQSHSKSHRNLIERGAAETDARYRLAIDAEMRVPRELLARRIEGTTVQHIAWPFGDANATVLEAAARNGFELGATVMPGGNAFYAQPLMLRRTMIFGDMDLDAFRARLQTMRSWGSP
ncbi:MAG: polysaccharide deacetylase family protein [Rubrivivax sp.]|nr:polysaccharide deacetylase family protein [Rubrivivax sp.]